MAVGYFEVDASQDKLSLDKDCRPKQKFQILGQLSILQVYYNRVWIILSTTE